MPRFGSEAEEAAWWDKTDTAGLRDDGKRVKLRVERPLKLTFALRLEPATVDELRRIAKRRGIGVTQLVRSWIGERLDAERGASASTSKTEVVGKTLREATDRIAELVVRRLRSRGKRLVV